MIQLMLGDCLEVMAGMEAESVDTIITDPPYGLSKQPDIKEAMRAWLSEEEFNGNGGGFMGKKWDSFVPGPRYWEAAYRVLKPGGMLLCFAGTRTADLMGISLRFAGFEIRDTLMWLYGSG